MISYRNMCGVNNYMYWSVTRIRDNGFLVLRKSGKDISFRYLAGNVGLLVVIRSGIGTKSEADIL